MADDIAARVSAIITEHLCVNKPVDATDHLVDDLGADSLDTVEITMAIEEEYPGVQISDEESEACRTVADWVALVERKQA